VWVCLAMNERNLSCAALTASAISAIIQSLNQLQEIVGIIARYTVMENLYQQSGGALSLKPEYKIELLSLCTTILEYFSASFAIAKKTAYRIEDEQTNLKIFEELMAKIRAKDKACQGFMVVVDIKEDSGIDSEELDVGHMSDESWEHVGIEECLDE